MSDFNVSIIDEFRANEGRVGGPFEGAPMVLVHNTGRKSGAERINPMMYLPSDDPDAIYVVASAGGRPTSPDWYYNLISSGTGSVEIGTDAYDVVVDELQGEERDKIFSRQAALYPGFADYARKTEGIRTIPVLRLTRT